jgi:NAD(P)H-flavin reductase
VVLTLPIREVLPATPRARIARLDLNSHAFDFAAGQAVLVATHGLDDRRPYSIAVAPEDARRDRYIELLVGIDPGGLPGPHLRLEPGGLVDIEGPLGAFTFPVAPEEQRFVFIAGGTGIAPLRAMLRHALTIPHRNIGLFYSARTPDEFAYEEELRSLAIAGDIELRQTVTRASEADWTGWRGRLGRDALEELVHDPATLCFVCGPRALVDEMPRLLAELGIARARIRIEEWGTPPLPDPPALPGPH